jgi:hypothetical protein
MNRQPQELCNYIGHLPREQIREMIAEGRLRMCSPENPGWPLTEHYAMHPPPPVQEPDWDATQAQTHENWRVFFERQARDRPLERHARNARERAAQGLEWVGFPDPLMRLFMPQFKMMAARGLESVQHTRNHVQLRIQEVAEALQRQARADIPLVPHALAHIDLTKPDQRAALAAFLVPIYARYEQHLRTREMEHLQSLSSVNELRYRWLSLHRFLVARGFSEASVEEFILQQEHLASSDQGMSRSPLQLAAREIEQQASALDPALRQFRENYEPVDRQILDGREAYENDMRTAMAMGQHQRLGAEASQLARGNLEAEVTNLIWSYVFPPRPRASLP